MERDDARQGSDLPVWEDALAPLRLKLETEARAGARIKVCGVGGGGGHPHRTFYNGGVAEGRPPRAKRIVIEATGCRIESGMTRKGESA